MTFPVYRCEEWQCRHVFPDRMCCIRKIGHDGAHQKPEAVAVGYGPYEEPVCEHGTAMDVHCCGCHSGFLFDVQSCTCLEEPESADAVDPSGQVRER